jgi:protein-S-isoprenylcysteine O-methyltransferase Ste14
MKWYEASALVAAIFAAFAIIHSLLVTDAAKSVARKLLGEGFVRSFYRLIYTVISVITTVLAVYLIIIVPDEIIYTPPLWARLICHAVQFTGIAIGAIAFKNIHLGEFYGLSQTVRALRGKEQLGDEEGLKQYLITTSIYGVVRHPMYLAGILLFTFNPYLTRTWLTVSVMADLYFVVGALLEERRLISRFGDEYRAYMKRVPRFIPRFF